MNIAGLEIQNFVAQLSALIYQKPFMQSTLIRTTDCRMGEAYKVRIPTATSTYGEHYSN